MNADSSNVIIEDQDWLDNVPSPGITISQELIDSTWNCPIDNCDNVYSLDSRFTH